MDANVPEKLLETFANFIEARAGLHFPRGRWADLRNALREAAPEAGCKDAEQCAKMLLSGRAGKDQIELVISHLTVGETYFFRDSVAFEALETKILPEIIRSRRTHANRLRIWSAGCCTGEEPYSIAIAVARALPDLEDWDVTIHGTDINPRFLRKAEAGIYGQWSFRDIPEEIKKHYFRHLGNGRFEILPKIKQMVTFACLNLVEDESPSLLYHTNAMDLIFCRNVLMYFSREQAKNVARKLYRSLVDGGCLFPSGSDASPELFGQFTLLEIPETMIYRKSASATFANMRSSALAEPLSAPEDPQPARKTSKENSKRPERIPHARSASPENITVGLSKRARDLANEGRLTEALTACDEAVREDKLAAPLHYLRGLILDETGAHEEAAVALERALYLDHDFVLAHFALGNLRRRQTRVRNAKRCFENATALLRQHDLESVLPESGGITAGRLLAILEATQNSIGKA